MNKVKALFAIALLLFAATSFAQTSTLKIGYTNVDYVLSQMPESRQIESDLKAYSSQLEGQLKSKIEEYQRKEDAYKKGAATMTDVVRADKEKELINMQNSIQEFQRNADASLQKKQQSLLEPALEKLQKAIDDVAAENGYAYIFNSDAGFGTTPILLHGPKDDDISDLVLKKLGATPAPKATPAKTTPSKKK